MPDDRVRCSKCRRKYPVTTEHWYFRADGTRNGAICRHCRHVKRRKPTAKCRHCHEPILGRTSQADYHIDADHPECYAARQAHLLDKQRKYREAAKKLQVDRKGVRKDKRRARGPLCPVCRKHRMPAGHYFMCRYCQQDYSDDGELIYFGELKEESDGEQAGASNKSYR